MKRMIAGMIAVAVLGVGVVAAAQSSKVTAKTAAINLIPRTTGTGAWQTILSNSIKVPNNKDLFVTVSLEAGLFTQTLVSSKTGTKDTSTSQAAVHVRVLLEGSRVVEPGEVVFGSRTQTLSATLEGMIANCLFIVTNPDGTQSILLDPACVTPETIELILDTMQATSFSFVAVDVPVGVHSVSVQARVDTTAGMQTGTASAMATVGKGSLVVESVRLVKDPNVILEVP